MVRSALARISAGRIAQFTMLIPDTSPVAEDQPDFTVNEWKVIFTVVCEGKKRKDMTDFGKSLLASIEAKIGNYVVGVPPKCKVCGNLEWDFTKFDDAADSHYLCEDRNN